MKAQEKKGAKMIATVLEMHGKKFKVFRVDDSKHDGQNKKLLGTFKTSQDAIRFMNTLAQ